LITPNPWATLGTRVITVGRREEGSYSRACRRRGGCDVLKSQVFFLLILSEEL